MIIRSRRTCAALLVFGLGLITPAVPAAQVPPGDLAAEPRIRFGPVGLTPRLAIRDVGIDTNVFNSTEAERDFTAALVPGIDAAVRLGPFAVATRTGVEWTYYRTHTRERSFNLNQDVRVDLLFYRLAPYGGASLQQTRQRTNFEIDERVLMRTMTVIGGVRWRPGSRIAVDLEGGRREVDYGDREFGNAALAEVLNRQVEEARLALRVELTPLTTFAVRSAASRDRFEFTALRDTDSVSVLAGFELEPVALIAGAGFVGLKQFSALSPAVPDFRGVVADVDVSYTLREMTRFAVTVDRDVEYSLEPLQPYYISTSSGLRIVQAIGEAWDVTGRVGLAHLDYQNLLTADQPVISETRRDRVTSYGLGFGRRFGERVRLGLDVDRVQRESPLAGREYDGYRSGGSVTYGY